MPLWNEAHFDNPERQEAVKSLAMRMFPRLKLVWGNMGYSPEHLTIWRNELRICSPEVFDIYFQLGVSEQFLSNSEFNAFLGVIDSAERWRLDPARMAGNPLADFSEEELKRLAQELVTRLRNMRDEDFVQCPELDLVNHRWHQWGDPSYVKDRVNGLFVSEALLPVVLEGYMRYGTRQGSDDRVATRTARVNPKDFEELTDIYSLEPRVRTMLSRQDLSARGWKGRGAISVACVR